MKKTINRTATLMGAMMLLLSWASCHKEQLPLYEDGRYVQFQTDYRDSVNFSFFFHFGKDEVRIPLPVRLTGQLPDQDMTYRIEAVREEGTASPDHYTLPEAPVFRKGQHLDTAWVTLRKTPEMAQRDIRLVLRIASGGELLPGQTTYAYKIFRISDMVSKPVWWDTNMDRFYLGRYSEAKFRKFMEVTGVGDLEPHDQSQRLVFMLQFKYYLIDQKAKGTPVYMEDGSDMLSTVPLIG